jgi:hypothetical protein
MHVLTKPQGSHGGYAFDDPMLGEWMGRSTTIAVPTGVKVIVRP